MNISRITLLNAMDKLMEKELPYKLSSKVDKILKELKDLDNQMKYQEYQEERIKERIKDIMPIIKGLINDENIINIIETIEFEDNNDEIEEGVTKLVNKIYEGYKGLKEAERGSDILFNIDKEQRYIKQKLDGVDVNILKGIVLAFSLSGQNVIPPFLIATAIKIKEYKECQDIII